MELLVNMIGKVCVAVASHSANNGGLRLRNKDNICVFATPALQANRVVVCNILFLTENHSRRDMRQLLVFKDTEKPHDDESLSTFWMTRDKFSMEMPRGDETRYLD